VEKVAELFSISRPLTSTKLVRKPTRGALGNGLRVVVGAVIASGGTLILETRGKRLTLIPHDNGSTVVVDSGAGMMIGTRVEVVFGPNMPNDVNPLGWAKKACSLAGDSQIYSGATSPHWEDGDAFFDRCRAAGDATVRQVVSEFDGCSGKAGVIVKDFKGRAAASLTREEASRLLERARNFAVVIKPARLRLAKQSGVELTGFAHAHEVGVFSPANTGRSLPAKDIPYTVEAWAAPSETDRVELCVNRTPAVANTGCRRAADKARLVIWGCELGYEFKVGRRPLHLVRAAKWPEQYDCALLTSNRNRGVRASRSVV
jgi:hypothetical protein